MSNSRNTKIAVLIILSLMYICKGCSIDTDSGKDVSSTVNWVENTVTVSEYSKLDVSGSFDIVVIDDADPSIMKIEAPDEMSENIFIEVIDDTLHINLEDDSGLFAEWGFNMERNMKIMLSPRNLDEVTLAVASSFTADRIVADNLELELNGIGEINIDNLVAEELTVHIVDVGIVNLAGQVTKQEIDVSRAGQYSAKELISQIVKIDVSRAGSASVYATSELDAKVSGVGKIEYYGSPETVSQDVSHLGQLEAGIGR